MIWTTPCLLLVGCAASLFGAGASTIPATNELTGHLINTAAGTNHILFQTSAGTVYALARNERSEALFVDTNLWSKTLVLKTRILPNQHEIEVAGNLHSLRGVQLCELYYYCDVCAIKTSDPGLCMCCREPVKLMERPVWKIRDGPP